jgi:hypothetical protein
MIRFIDLETQINEEPEFAFYCTIKDRFLVFNGVSTWSNADDFTDDYNADDGDDIYRYLLLIPPEF